MFFTGNQTVKHDRGDFFTINGHRLRKEEVLGYGPDNMSDEGDKMIVYIQMMGIKAIGLRCENVEERTKLLEQIDWLLKEKK